MPDLPADYFERPLTDVDPEVADAIAAELDRQQRTLEMIASENFVPHAILECQGSVLTNKYAEGYPGKRYYGGCEHVDVIEQLAIDRAKALFGAEHATCSRTRAPRPTAPSTTRCCSPGHDHGLSLAHGGHLSHGMKLNVSGRLYDIAPYEVARETNLIDMDDVSASRTSASRSCCSRAGRPTRVQEFERFRARSRMPSARADGRHGALRGLVAAGLHSEPGPSRRRRAPPTIHKTLGGARAG
jgi:glycine hydroxymethyltransferase